MRLLIAAVVAVSFLGMAAEVSAKPSPVQPGGWCVIHPHYPACR